MPCPYYCTYVPVYNTYGFAPQYTNTAKRSTNKDATSSVHGRHTIVIEISMQTLQKAQLVVGQPCFLVEDEILRIT